MDAPGGRAATAAMPLLGTVLCAIDGSSSAASVLYTAAGLAAAPGSRLIVLRVDQKADAARPALHDFVQQTIPGWLADRRETELITRAGASADTILRIADEHAVNLIVMGTHAKGTLARLLFGSVTDAVVKKATVPVAVVPPTNPEVISLTERKAVPHLGSVLVPVDLESRSARQLMVASRLALASPRDITLLHAIPEQADSAGPLQRLQEIASGVEAPAAVRAIVTHGPLVSVIIDRQLRSGAGVVVMGRDTGSPGRVARELLHKTRAVVIVVP